jgi:hypothetical protein
MSRAAGCYSLAYLAAAALLLARERTVGDGLQALRRTMT